jgi:hypothetical protein
MIVMVSRNTLSADGALWEIACAKEEAVPVLGVHIHKKDKVQLPGCRIVEWTWPNIAAFVDSL